MRRLLYIGYYAKNTPMKYFIDLVRYANNCTGRSPAAIAVDVVRCSLKYNISFEDYFLFKFFKEEDDEYREKWAGAGFMYEFQKHMNPPALRQVLSDKRVFLEHFAFLANRRWATRKELKQNHSLFHEMSAASQNRRIVVKNSSGQAGEQVQVLDACDYSVEGMLQLMQEHGYDLVEQAIDQHNDLMALSPDGLNTIRVITQIDENNDVHVVACRLRVSVNARIDNFHQGGFVVALDSNNGRVISKGTFRDPRKDSIEFHPKTSVKLEEFVVPHWDKVLDTAIKAANACPQNRSVGWDIAVKESTVELIEGNANWNYGTLQLPLSRGLKETLQTYFV